MSEFFWGFWMFVEVNFRCLKEILGLVVGS